MWLSRTLQPEVVLSLRLGFTVNSSSQLPLDCARPGLAEQMLFFYFAYARYSGGVVLHAVSWVSALSSKSARVRPS